MKTLILILVCVAAGYWFGRHSVQSANGLIEAGFTITDPFGFEIERFE